MLTSRAGITCWHHVQASRAGNRCCSRRQVVRLYDAQALQHLQQLLPPASSSSSASSAGFGDCQFTRAAPYTLAAAGYSGQVHLWDQRASNTARLALSAARGSGICSLQVAAGGHYIYGAASTGHQVGCCCCTTTPGLAWPTIDGSRCGCSSWSCSCLLQSRQHSAATLPVDIQPLCRHATGAASALPAPAR